MSESTEQESVRASVDEAAVGLSLLAEAHPGAGKELAQLPLPALLQLLKDDAARTVPDGDCLELLPGAWNSKPPAQPVGNGGSVKVKELGTMVPGIMGVFVRNGSFAGVGFAVHAGSAGAISWFVSDTDISAIGRIDLRVLGTRTPGVEVVFQDAAEQDLTQFLFEDLPASVVDPTITDLVRATSSTLVASPANVSHVDQATLADDRAPSCSTCGAPVGADANFCNTCGQATRATSDSHGQVQSATPSAGAATHPSAPGYEAKTAARALATSLVALSVFVAAGFFINVLSSNSGTGTVMGIAVREWPWEVEAYQSSQWLYFLYWVLSPFVVAGTALVVVAVPRWRVDAAGFAMMAGVAGIANHTGLLLEGYSFDPGWLPIIVALEALVGFAVIVLALWMVARLPEAPNVPPGYRYAALCLAGAALAIAAITFEGFDRFIWLLPFVLLIVVTTWRRGAAQFGFLLGTLFFNMIWWLAAALFYTEYAEEATTAGAESRIGPSLGLAILLTVAAFALGFVGRSRSVHHMPVGRKVVGISGGTHKSVKQLDTQIASARMTLAMYGDLPDDNKAIARQKVGDVLQAAARAAAAAGQADEARAHLDAALGQPPVPEPADLNWNDLIGQAKASLS